MPPRNSHDIDIETSTFLSSTPKRPISITTWIAISIRTLRLLSSLATLILIIYMTTRYSTNFSLAYIATSLALFLDSLAAVSIKCPSLRFFGAKQHRIVRGTLYLFEIYALGMLVGSVVLLVPPYLDSGDMEAAIWGYRLAAAVLQGVGAGMSFFVCIIGCCVGGNMEESPPDV